MNGDVILTRPVTVQGWRVIGQVAKAEKREELTPILERARESDGTNASDLAHHLFFLTRARSLRNGFCVSGITMGFSKNVEEITSC